MPGVVLLKLLSATPFPVQVAPAVKATVCPQSTTLGIVLVSKTGGALTVILTTSLVLQVPVVV